MNKLHAAQSEISQQQLTYEMSHLLWTLKTKYVSTNQWLIYYTR